MIICYVSRGKHHIGEIFLECTYKLRILHDYKIYLRMIYLEQTDRKQVSWKLIM